MNTKIKYQVKNGWFDLSFFWEQGDLSLSNSEIIINGDCNYKIPFSSIMQLSHYMPRMGAGLFIIFKFDKKTFHIRIPDNTCLSSTTSFNTENLYQRLKEKIKK